MAGPPYPSPVPPARRDLTLYAGDDYAHRLTFTGPGGAPIALEGAYAAEVRNAAGQVVATFAVDATGAGAGVLVLELTGAQTAALPRLPAETVWDLERTLDGRRLTYLRGRVLVEGDVTRLP